MRITMKQAFMSVVVLAASVLPTFAQANMNAQEQANLKFVLDWWREVIQSRHMELAPKYQAENYIQHNINIKKIIILCPIMSKKNKIKRKT